jgi:hypothetical protein
VEIIVSPALETLSRMADDGKFVMEVVTEDINDK